MKNHYELLSDVAKVYSNGKHKERFFFVDQMDIKTIANHSWRVIVFATGYSRVETSILENKKVRHFSLARFLLNFPDGYADHIDRNPLNNRRANIRVATPCENSHNASKYKEKTTSKYKGVCFHKRKNLWFSYINANGKRFNLGYFKNEQDAANAYDLKAKELHNEFAVLNNP